MKPWHSMFCEADGNVSSTRVCMIFAVVAVLGTWSVLSFVKGQVLDIPSGPVILVSATYGLKKLQQKDESVATPCEGSTSS